MIIKATDPENVKVLKIRAYLKKHGSIRLNVPKAKHYVLHPILSDINAFFKDDYTIELAECKIEMPNFKQV